MTVLARVGASTMKSIADQWLSTGPCRFGYRLPRRCRGKGEKCHRVRWDITGCVAREGETIASKCGNRLPSILAWLLTVLLLGGCAGQANPGGASSTSPAPAPGVTSAWSLVNALSAAGLAVPNPRNVTDQRCADIHCAGAVAADTVSVLVFGRSRDAQLYEASLSNGYQVGDVVLEFAPTTDAAQIAAYEAVVARAAG